MKLKFHSSLVAGAVLLSVPTASAFTPGEYNGKSYSVILSTLSDTRESVDVVRDQDATIGNPTSLSNDIKKLKFREIQRQLEQRSLDTSGTLSAMKDRLRQASSPMQEQTVAHVDPEERIIDEDALNKVSPLGGLHHVEKIYAIENILNK